MAPFTKSESSTSSPSRSVTLLTTHLTKSMVSLEIWSFQSRLNSNLWRNLSNCQILMLTLRFMTSKKAPKTPFSTNALLLWALSDKNTINIQFLGTGKMDKHSSAWSRIFIQRNSRHHNLTLFELLRIHAAVLLLLWLHFLEVLLLNKHSRPSQENTCPSISISSLNSLKSFHLFLKLKPKSRLSSKLSATKNQLTAETKVWEGSSEINWQNPSKNAEFSSSVQALSDANSSKITPW